MSNKNISVISVVVTFNAYHSDFFPRCLERLTAINLDGDDFNIDHKIIVVDSHSGDGTADKVMSSYPDINVIASGENLGYAGGNNVGFAEALKRNPDYIAVVTQDVYVQPDWLINAIKAAESDKKIGVVQPLLLLWPERELINTTGNAIHFLGYGYSNDYRKSLSDYHNSQIIDIPYFSGAVCLFPSCVIREVGNFDDEMWMYNEDQDLGWRLWLHGYKNVMAPASRCFHQYEFSRSISKMYFMDRNRLLVMFQNYHWATLLLVMPFLLINELATLLFAISGGWKKEKLAVWKYFLKPIHWSKLLQKRRLRQVSRTVRERDIIKRFTGKILFQDVINPVIKYVANPVLDACWRLIKVVIFW